MRWPFSDRLLRGMKARHTGEPCSGSNLRPCARWKLCPPCNDVVARRASARIHQTIEMLEIGPKDVYALTITLPGSWHGIRKSSIWAQYAYITGRNAVSGRTGLWPMRGLNLRLQEGGVLGGWHFIECTFNDKTKCWNMHAHSILLGKCPDWLPMSETIVDEEFNRKLKSSKSVELEKIGFGERYTLDRCQDTGQVVGYCVALAYSSKQALKGPSKDLQAFLRSVKPRMVRPFGIARMSMQERINWHLEHENHDIADMLMSKAKG